MLRRVFPDHPDHLLSSHVGRVPSLPPDLPCDCPATAEAQRPKAKRATLTRMSSSEVSWKARLQSVPHDELIGLLSTLLSQQSLGRVAADAVIAKHVPPSEAQATVFLSADLIDALFETLQLTDSAA